jgi:hypothetical protein
MSMNILLCTILFTVSAFSQLPVTALSPLPEDLVIEVDAGSNGLIFTNNVSAAFATETKNAHRFPWQGFQVMGKEVLKDYAIRIDDMLLKREDVVRVLVSPFQYTRVYRNGVEETVYMLDSINAVVVDLKNVASKSLSVYPMLSGSMDDSDYYSLFELNVLLIARTNHIESAAHGDQHPAVAVSLVNELYSAAGFYESHNMGLYFSPSYISTVKKDALHRLLIAAGDSVKDAYVKLKTAAKFFSDVLGKRNKRYGELFAHVLPSLDDANARKAFSWAIIGTDGLMTDGTKLFDLYQSGGANVRSSVLPIPGGGLLLGSKEQSRAYLRALASLQDGDSSHATYGQILGKAPSSKKPALDVAPWLTLAVKQYFGMTNDSSVVQELYPAIRRSIEGMLKFHVEKNYTVRTVWIDAQASALGHPTSSKGKKIGTSARELWKMQLNAGVDLARYAGDMQSMARWQKISLKLSQGSKK